MSTPRHRLRGSAPTGAGWIALGLLILLLGPGVTLGGVLEPYATDSDIELRLPDLKGEVRTLQDYRGQVVLVNFWASWCPPCIREMPGMQRLKDQMAGRPFEILTVNVAEARYRVGKFVKRIDLALEVLLDTGGETFKAWQARILPTSFLVDKQGRIRYRALGPLAWDEEEAVSVIGVLVSEPSP